MLGHLCMIFHGAGSNNYCSEILHFLFNMKGVWTPEFAYVDLRLFVIDSESFSVIACVIAC
jgi:hypothetical protein